MQTTYQVPDPGRAKAYFEQKIAFTTGPVEVENSLKARENIVIVDVREAEDFSKGHIPGAINLPRERWDNPQGLQKNRANIVYCYTPTCHLAAQACVALAGKGFPVMEMDGGFEAWRENDFEVESGPGSRIQGEKAFSR